MSVRRNIAFATLIMSMTVFVTSTTARRAVTTGECLGNGKCAYVDTHGHVTCGKCPGQVVAHAIRYPRGTTAICNNGTFTHAAPSGRMCRAAGGIATRVTL